MIKIFAIFLLLLSPSTFASNMAGEQIYKTYCAGCHLESGLGNGLCANLVEDKSRLAKADEELFMSIKNGKGMMPAYGWILSDKDIIKVIKYLRDTFE